MKKKLLMLITAGLCIMSMVVFTACDKNADAEEPTEATEATSPTEATEEMPDKVITDSAYDPVIAKYKEVEKNGFQASEEDIYHVDMEGSGEYDGTDGVINGMLLEDLQGMEGAHIYYALYDINNDTCDELLIGGGDSPETARLYDIFTFDEGAALRIIPGNIQLGYRTNGQILNSGVVEVIFSGGAASTAYAFLEIPSDDIRLKTVTMLSYEGDPGDPDAPADYHDGPDLENEITEEDFNKILDDYEGAGAVTPDWQPVV